MPDRSSRPQSTRSTSLRAPSTRKVHPRSHGPRESAHPFTLRPHRTRDTDHPASTSAEPKAPAGPAVPAGPAGPADPTVPAGPATPAALVAPEATATPAVQATSATPVPATDRIAAAKPASAAPEPDPGRRRAIRLALILVASFMMVLDFSIVNVALPSIQRELHLSTSAVDWVVTAYAIAFGGLLILGGRAADMLGRRRMFVVGLVTFSLASLSGGLAQDPVLLLASRVVQGAAAAVVLPAALSLITTSFPEGRERTRALGLYGATASLGFVAGQVLGGVLVELTSWRSVFLVNVPVGIVAALIAPRVLGHSANLRDARGGRHLDVRGALLITLAIALAVFAVSEGNVFGWLSPVVLGSAVVAVAAGLGFALAEAHHPEPLIRLDMFQHAGLRRGSALALLMGLWNGGEMLVLSLYFQQVLHESPLVTGLAIAPQGMAGFLAGIYGSQLAARFGGVRRLLAVTGALAATGFLVLTQLPASGYSPLLLAVMLIGFGTAGTAFGSIVIASRGVPDRDQGLVGGMINTSRQIGAAIGAALLPAVAVAIGHGASGDRAAMLTGAIASALAMLIAWRAVRADDRAAQAA
ncbi:MAG TPA: MFS transporter [Streptosporangiaceae bacterium]|nr:MFS transporter [Streptosporangiaceae bacterium]